MRKMGGKTILFVLLFLFSMGAVALAETDSDLWKQLVDKATTLYRQGEDAKDKGDLLKAYFLLSEASFMFPKDKALQAKLENLKLKIEAKLSSGDCDQGFLLDKLQAAEKELLDLKKRLVQDKEELQAYYDQKLEQLKKSYEDKIEILDEKYKFELEKQQAEYQKLLEDKQKEYRDRLGEYKDKVKAAIVSLQQGLQSKDEEIAKKDEKIKELLKSYSSLEDLMDRKYKAQIMALNEKVSAYEKRIASLEDRVRTQKRYNDSLEKALADKKAEVEKLKVSLKDANDRISLLKQESKESSISSEKKYQDCLAKIVDAKGKIKTLNQEIEKLKMDKENIMAKFDVNNNKVMEQQEMLQDLQERLKERDIIIRNLKDKINGLKRKLFVLEHEKKTGGFASSTKEKSFHAGLFSRSGKQETKPEAKASVSSTKDLSADELFEKAMELIDEQEYEMARDLLKQVLEKQPDNTVARYMLDSVNLLLED